VRSVPREMRPRGKSLRVRVALEPRVRSAHEAQPTLRSGVLGSRGPIRQDGRAV